MTRRSAQLRASRYEPDDPPREAPARPRRPRLRAARRTGRARTVRVAAGTSWEEIDAVTSPLGLATPGDVGHLTRRFGLALDNLLEADVVFADGRVAARRPGRAPRPLLGAARRRRDRPRHLVAVPAARARAGRRRPDVLADRARGRRAARLPRVPPRRPAHADRGVHAAPRAVPGGAARLRRALVRRLARGDRAVPGRRCPSRCCTASSRCPTRSCGGRSPRPASGPICASSRPRCRRP